MGTRRVWSARAATVGRDCGVDVDEDLAFRAETAPVIVLTGLAGVKRES